MRTGRGGSTCHRPSGTPKSLGDLISQFIAERGCGGDDDRKFLRGLGTFSAVLDAVAMCRRADGKRHPHQRRIPRRVLHEVHRGLAGAGLEQCGSFDDLHGRVETATLDVRGVGTLTVYDISIRLGRRLGLEPEVVYLHSGTLVGARALGFRGRATLRVDELPAPLRRLSASDIEDFLCIYKDDLRRLAK